MPAPGVNTPDMPDTTGRGRRSRQGHDFDDFDFQMFSGGIVCLAASTFSGGTVDFSGATGDAPSDLVPPSGAPLAGLLLPPTWSG